MSTDAPKDARLAARVILVNEANRILLLHAMNEEGSHFWIMPGGGLQEGEGFSDAANRELHEETGIRAMLGPWVWTRRHTFQWKGVRHDQYERYFVAETQQSKVAPTQSDDYIVGHRWWTLEELADSDERFAPRKLADLLPSILSSDYPKAPIDCGV